MEIKDKIKYLREIKGWTTSVLAKNSGVAQSTISYIENGKSNPSYQVIKKLAKSFNVDVSDLVAPEKNINLAEKIKNLELLDQFIQISKLSKKNQEIIQDIIASFLKGNST